MSEPLSAIILAGGASRRMGQPKAILPFRNSTILETILSEFAPAFDDLILVAAPLGSATFSLDEVLGRWRDRVTLLRDEQSFAGPVAALVRGLRLAKHPIAFACSCDLPLLQLEVARYLCDQVGGYDAAVPSVHGNLQPLCAAYRRAAYEKIERAARSGEQRLTAIVAGMHIQRIGEAELRRIDPELHSFFNVNTPEDYAYSLKLAKGRSA